MQNTIINDDVNTDILNSINEGVFTVDRDWRITSFNAAAARITQIDPREAIGNRCCDVFRANICETACALRATMASGKPVINTTARIIDNQGRAIPIRISTALLKDDDGEIIGGVETFQDISQIDQLQKELKGRYTFEDIVGRSPAMLRIFELLPLIADTSSTVLITGASGTGKELVARALHNLSPRKKGPFVALNCAALPDTLLESELFGHKAGAFTDARRDKPGRFQQAENGSLFLDEIGDISPAVQVRLLRVLQERIVEPLGSIKPVPVNVRVIAATNRNLTREVQKQNFREDLFYRIKVINIDLPPLSARREDIPLLTRHIIERLNRRQGRNILSVSPEVSAIFMEYDFPGNIRELENILEQAFVFCRGDLIEVQHLPAELRPDRNRTGLESGSAPLTLQQLEQHFITEALARNRGNRQKTARELGIDVSTLFRKIKKLKINLPETDGRANR